MPTLPHPTAKSSSRRVSEVGKKSPAIKRKVAAARPSFGEWARRVSGMMKDGPPDLSMREGFGD